MSERIRIAELRARVTDTYAAPMLSRAEALALIEAVEAAHAAAILEYDPRRTDEQNQAIGARAQRLYRALRHFDFTDSA